MAEFSKASLPATLPEVPAGWKKRMAMHLNFGRAKGGVYDILDPEGRVMPFAEVYRVRDKNPANNYAGYRLPGQDTIFTTWAALREAWPAYYATLPDH